MPRRAKIAVLLIFIGAAVVGLSLPRLAHAADERENAAAADLARDVKRLIRQLNSEQLATRQAAEQQLLELGPAALPHLPPQELIPQTGVRVTVARIAVELERRQGQRAAQATRIDLTGKMTFQEFVASAVKQTGNQINAKALPEALLDQTVDMNFQQIPFWRGLDQILEGVGKPICYSGKKDQLMLEVCESQPAQGIAYSGPFRVTVTSLRRRPEYGDVRVGLGIRAEPRLRPLFLTFNAGEVSGVTDDGRPLTTKNPGASKEYPLGDGGDQTPLSLDLKGAEEPVSAMSLSGKLNVTTATNEQHIRFRDLLKSEGVERRWGGLTVKLHDVAAKETNPGVYDLRLQVAVIYDVGGPAFESHRTWIYHNRVYLETDDGERVEFGGGQYTSLTREGAVLNEYHFPKLKRPAADYRFVYVAPTAIVDIPLNFRFKKLRLENTDPE